MTELEKQLIKQRQQNIDNKKDKDILQKIIILLFLPIYFIIILIICLGFKKE